MIWGRRYFYYSQVQVALTTCHPLAQLPFVRIISYLDQQCLIFTAHFLQDSWMNGIFSLSLTGTIWSNTLHILLQTDLAPLACLQYRVYQVCKCPPHGLFQWRPIQQIHSAALFTAVSPWCPYYTSARQQSQRYPTWLPASDIFSRLLTINLSIFCEALSNSSLILYRTFLN